MSWNPTVPKSFSRITKSTTEKKYIRLVKQYRYFYIHNKIYISWNVSPCPYIVNLRNLKIFDTCVSSVTLTNCWSQGNNLGSNSHQTNAEIASCFKTWAICFSILESQTDVISTDFRHLSKNISSLVFSVTCLKPTIHCLPFRFMLHDPHVS